MPDTSQEMLVVAKQIAAALESIAMQLAQLNEKMADEMIVKINHEVRTRSS